LPFYEFRRIDKLEIDGMLKRRSFQAAAAGDSTACFSRLLEVLFFSTRLEESPISTDYRTMSRHHDLRTADCGSTR